MFFFLMHSSGPKRGVKKHSERGYQIKVLKTEVLGLQYITRGLLNFKARKTLSGLNIRKIALKIQTSQEDDCYGVKLNWARFNKNYMSFGGIIFLDLL